MSKILQTESTLTERYQTTIPEPIRALLNLKKRDKITYTLEEDGRVLISRAGENDPIQFLSLLANDLRNNPAHVNSMKSELLKSAQKLVSGMEVDFDAPLDEKDD